jgi:hypothetical protein
MFDKIWEPVSGQPSIEEELEEWATGCTRMSTAEQDDVCSRAAAEIRKLRAQLDFHAKGDDWDLDKVTKLCYVLRSVAENPSAWSKYKDLPEEAIKADVAIRELWKRIAAQQDELDAAAKSYRHSLEENLRLRKQSETDIAKIVELQQRGAKNNAERVEDGGRIGNIKWEND